MRENFPFSQIENGFPDDQTLISVCSFNGGSAPCRRRFALGKSGARHECRGAAPNLQGHTAVPATTLSARRGPLASVWVGASVASHCVSPTVDTPPTPFTHASFHRIA